MTMRDQLQRQIGRALTAVRQAFRGSIGRVQSGTPIQLVALDGLAGESLRDVEQFQDYGFTSNPPAGTMAVVLPLGGRTSHGIVVATEHGSYRLLALATGEVAIYSDEGASVVIRRGRVIEAVCDTYRVICQDYQVQASNQAAFTTPKVSTSAELEAAGKMTGQGGLAVSGGDGAHVEGGLHATEDVTAGAVSLLGHKHTGDSGGTTSAPIA
ncbi:phage baseplate assembly protein V [Castellaniella caeni]|uniref:phage baseplate assembly protein V n=1 Tax=Castellaniella caeni TaxID=266123 RepID=UPI0021551B62|nr:phage baseplate assembly protein V [Castellaniella caeni]